MEIDATSSGSSGDSNPGQFPGGGFYGENLFFPGLVGKRDFDAYFGKEQFCQKRNDGVVGEKGGAGVSGGEVAGKRGVYGGDYAKKVEEFAEINNRKGSNQHGVGFYSNAGKKGGENEIQLNSIGGFGKKTISFSPDQVGKHYFQR